MDLHDSNGIFYRISRGIKTPLCILWLLSHFLLVFIDTMSMTELYSHVIITVRPYMYSSVYIALEV